MGRRYDYIDVFEKNVKEVWVRFTKGSREARWYGCEFMNGSERQGLVM